MSEYRATITVTEHGRRDVAEERSERVLEAFERLYPAAGAVLGANFHLGLLDVTFSVEADQAQTASDLAYEMFCKATEAAEITPTEIVEINVAAVAALDTTEALDDELLPA